MNRRTGLLVTTAFLAGIAVAGPAAHFLVPRFQPAFAGTVSSADAREQSLTLFGQVLERVRADYVDPVKTSTLIHYSLNGMLAGLDPHSGYMDPQEWHEMQLETAGPFRRPRHDRDRRRRAAEGDRPDRRHPRRARRHQAGRPDRFGKRQDD